jgi:hypothetical protein
MTYKEVLKKYEKTKHIVSEFDFTNWKLNMKMAIDVNYIGENLPDLGWIKFYKYGSEFGQNRIHLGTHNES